MTKHPYHVFMASEEILCCFLNKQPINSVLTNTQQQPTNETIRYFHFQYYVFCSVMVEGDRWILSSINVDASETASRTTGMASLRQTRDTWLGYRVEDEHNRHNIIVFVPRWHEWRVTSFCLPCVSYWL
jgi:hypothetical protein